MFGPSIAPTATRHRPLLVAIAAASMAAATLAGCSGSSDAGGTAATPTTAPDPAPPGSDSNGEVTEEEGASVEEFEGSVEDFYRVPDPLPEGDPGDLIRTQAIPAAEGATGDRESLRIMYHSTDAKGHDRAVTGTVTYPTGEAP